MSLGAPCTDSTNDTNIIKAKIMTEIRLPLLNCFVIRDFPSNHTLCSPSSGICYTCPLVSSYLSNAEQGQKICYSLWVLILLMGTIGIVTNCLNIILLLWKSPCGPSLTSLLIPLSIFDMIASGFAISYSTLTLIILENMSRAWFTMELYHFSLVMYLLGRTGSLFIAILITVERYLVVGHPFKMKIWWSVRKTRVVALITSLLAVFTNMPRYFSVSLMENNFTQDIPQLQEFPYLFHSTRLGILFFRRMKWLGRMHFMMDFLLPLPILLLLNLLLFIKITQVNAQGRLLNRNQNHEVNSAKMFSIVVAVLLLCHILPISFYIVLTIQKINYRELSFSTTLSISVNASINFLIYCACGKLFRQRFRELIAVAFDIVKTCSFRTTDATIINNASSNSIIAALPQKPSSNHHHLRF